MSRRAGHCAGKDKEEIADCAYKCFMDRDSNHCFWYFGASDPTAPKLVGGVDIDFNRHTCYCEKGMRNTRSNFVVICTVQGELTANVIKSRLESEGIPVLLEYESASRVFAVTVDGLGKVRILVPQNLAEEAKQIIEPRECGQAEERRFIVYRVIVTSVEI